jgi:hypothetical protein
MTEKTYTVLELLKEIKNEVLEYEVNPSEPNDEAYNKAISDAEDVIRHWIRKVEDKEIGVVPV